MEDIRLLMEDFRKKTAWKLIYLIEAVETIHLDFIQFFYYLIGLVFKTNLSFFFSKLYIFYESLKPET